MDGTVPQTGFLPGRNRQNAEKQLLGRESASGLAGKRGFFANLPANRGFGRGRCDMAAFGGRFVLHVLAQTLWSIARLFCAKKAEFVAAQVALHAAEQLAGLTVEEVARRPLVSFVRYAEQFFLLFAVPDAR